jgi:hypothetical protein
MERNHLYVEVNFEYPLVTEFGFVAERHLLPSRRPLVVEEIYNAQQIRLLGRVMDELPAVRRAEIKAQGIALTTESGTNLEDLGITLRAIVEEVIPAQKS